MSRIGQAGRRMLYGCLCAAVASVCSAQSVDENGGAKISAPIVLGESEPPANSDPIPTPIRTSSGKVAEASTATKTTGGKPAIIGELQPLSPVDAPASSTNVIDAGKLVPLAPEVSPPAATKTPQTREPTADDKLAEKAPAELKPIQPASISREDATVPSSAASRELTTAANPKPAATKKSPPKAKAPEKPREEAAPAANFSFPQPVIPLESALRKLFRWSASRR